LATSGVVSVEVVYLMGRRILASSLPVISGAHSLALNSAAWAAGTCRRNESVMRQAADSIPLHFFLRSGQFHTPTAGKSSVNP
jgi:hypothetical protein